jgi:amino acid permease
MIETKPIVTDRSRLSYSGKADTVNAAYESMHSMQMQKLDACIVPRQREEPGADSSPWQVAINLIKCAVGAGSFSLPAAWRIAGFWAALGLTMAFGVLAALTACMLVDCERRMSQQAGRRLTYPELLLYTFPGKPGPILHLIAMLGITFTSVGVCVAYVDFIIGVLTGLLRCSQFEAMVLLFPCVLGLALMRSFRYLAFTSILGDIAVLAGLVGTVSFGIAQGASFTPPSELPAVNLAGIPQAAGNIAFLFLIHAVLLPIAQSMRSAPPASLEVAAPHVPAESATQSFASVAWSSYAVITLGNVAFGGVCYALFADSTLPNVIQNLQSGSAGVLSIQLLLCIDLLFTIPMVLAAGREICEGYAMASWLGGIHETLTRTLTRLVLVLIIFGAAAAIPSFGDVVALIGGLSNSLTGLILPPFLYSPDRPSPAHLVSLLGVGLLVSSTFSTVKGML